MIEPLQPGDWITTHLEEDVLLQAPLIGKVIRFSPLREVIVVKWVGINGEREWFNRPGRFLKLTDEQVMVEWLSK